MVVSSVAFFNQLFTNNPQIGFYKVGSKNSPYLCINHLWIRFPSFRVARYHQSTNRRDIGDRQFHWITAFGIALLSMLGTCWPERTSTHQCTNVDGWCTDRILFSIPVPSQVDFFCLPLLSLDQPWSQFFLQLYLLPAPFPVCFFPWSPFFFWNFIFSPPPTRFLFFFAFETFPTHWLTTPTFPHWPTHLSS